jgi:hypothetical protein
VSAPDAEVPEGGAEHVRHATAVGSLDSIRMRRPKTKASRQNGMLT